MNKASQIFKAGAASHPGLMTDRNEDNHRFDPQLGLFIVADGMGGHAAGEIASKIAVDTCWAILAEAIQSGQAPSDDPLQHAVQSAHEAIRRDARQNEAHRGMGSTLVVLWCPPSRKEFWIAHIGDSRGYLLRDGELQQITEDHTLYNELRQAGRLPRDTAQHPRRNMLSQALGGESWVVPDINHRALKSGDRVMLCSDGLTEMVTDGDIRSVLGHAEAPQWIAGRLVDMAIQRGGKDNVTVLVFEIS